MRLSCLKDDFAEFVRFQYSPAAVIMDIDNGLNRIWCIYHQELFSYGTGDSGYVVHKSEFLSEQIVSQVQNLICCIGYRRGRSVDRSCILLPVLLKSYVFLQDRPESRTTFPEEDPAFENECYFFDAFAF